VSGVSADQVAVIIPAYNEAAGIGPVLDRLAALDLPLEIIVVDDGSVDGTAEAAKRERVRLVCHRRNRGYGAALKSGIKASYRPWVLFLDADGTYPVEAIPAFLQAGAAAPMTVGWRSQAAAVVPILRMTAKRLLTRYAEYLVDEEIPDLNSGMRLVQRELVLRILRLLPNGFSFTSTLTLAALRDGEQIAYLEIPYARRMGKSKIRPVRDTFNFIVLITRSGALFNPLRVFLPVSGALFVVAALVLAHDVFILRNVTDSSTLFFLTSLQTAMLGILADVIAARGGQG